MPMALQSAGGVYVNNKLDHGEEDNFEALKKAVLAGEARKKEEEQERRRSSGLPAEEEKAGLGKRLWSKVKGTDEALVDRNTQEVPAVREKRSIDSSAPVDAQPPVSDEKREGGGFKTMWRRLSKNSDPRAADDRIMR